MEKIILLTESELQTAIVKAISWYFKQPQPFNIESPIIQQKDKENIELENIDDVLTLSVRTYNALKGQGINTIGDIHNTNKVHIKKIRHLGYKGLQEVNSILLFYGFPKK